jgi:hypothetical protein
MGVAMLSAVINYLVQAIENIHNLKDSRISIARLARLWPAPLV